MSRMTRKDIFATLDRLVSWLSAQIGVSIRSALIAFVFTLVISLTLKHEAQTLRLCLGVCS